MGMSRPLLGVTWLAVAILCSVLGVRAHAQSQSGGQQGPQLDPQLLNQQQPLTSTEKQQITSYVDFYLDELQNGSPQQVSVARSRLLDPLRRPQVPQGFMQGYTEVYVQRVLNRLAEGRDAMRLNVMIVAPRLAVQEALQLIQQGLTDENPGVRYWAAKALATIAQRPTDQNGLSSEQQLAALDLLRNSIGNESSNAVLTQLLQAMSKLEVREAFDALLDALIRRLAFHTNSAGEPMMPEQEALRNLFQTLVRLEAQGQNVQDPVRQIARAALLYMTIAARQAEQAEQAGQPLSPPQIADREAMIRLADQILRWAMPLPTMLGPAAQGQMPQPITNALTRREWNFILTQANEWRRLLRDASVPQDQLQLPQAGQ